MALVTKKKKSRKGLFIGIGIAVVVLLMVLPMLMNSGNGGYWSAQTSKGTIETYYTFSGNVASKNTQVVMAEKIVQISEIDVSEGDKVTSDTVLFTTSDGTEIKSKTSGTVNRIFVEADQQLMSGSQLCEIIDFENLEVGIRVDEYDLGCVEVGKKIDVSICALDKDITGTVSSISRTATSQNGVAYFTAKVDLDKDSNIKVGMTAEAKVLNSQATDVVILPMKALSFDEENNPFVYFQGNRPNEFTKTPVEVGITDGKNVEIKSGIGDNQTIYYKDPNASSGGGVGGIIPPRPNGM